MSIEESGPSENSSTHNQELSLPQADSQPFLPWPPPGLEQIQGSLMSTVSFLGLGGTVLVLPLLLSIGITQRFTSLGLFGFNWWILASTTGLGLILLAEGYHRLFRILRTGNICVRDGHSWRTVALVAADNTRDTGFLLQGARSFSDMEMSARWSLLRWRLLGEGFYFAASLWIVFGFLLSVFLAARGIIGISTLWDLTLIPIALLMLCGLFCRLDAGIMAFKAGRRVKQESTKETGGLISEWRSLADSRQLTGIFGIGSGNKAVVTRIVAAVASIVGLLVMIPIVTFTFMSMIVPANLTNAMPRFKGVQEKAELIEYLRPYRLEFDSTISPTQAGEALTNLNYVGTGGKPIELHLPPRILYRQAWQFGRRGKGIMAINLLEKPVGELTSEEWDIMRSEASNPAHREFAALGRAAEADFFGTFIKSPFPDTMTWSDFPIPRFQGVSDGAKAHIAKAAFELHSGEPTRAEQTIREVISSGLLMMDEHPTLIGNLIGIVIAGIGGNALESYYRVTGRPDDADAIMNAREELEQRVREGGSRYRALMDYYHTEEFLDDMSFIVTDERMLRGLRWEFLPWVTTGACFTNLNNAVFGPGEDFDRWLSKSHDSLVRYQSEEELFSLLENGFFISKSSREQGGFLEWLLSLTFGKSGTPGSFTALLRAFR